MFRFKVLTISLLINAALAFAAYAQTPTTGGKIGFIDSAAFYDEKVGITKVVNINKQLSTEFDAKFKELQDGSTRLQAIAKELDTMQKLPQAQFNQVAFNAKQEEGERLQRELTYKKTDLESVYNKRRAELFMPINKDIGGAINDYAKKNGYAVILDIGKFDEAGAVLYFAEAADATKDFIAFYNTRPATTAPASVPVK